jgi:L-threonylcarbamoyladenylate synthase
MDSQQKDIINKIKNSGIGVMPTDTIYGLVTSALDPVAVEKVYDLRDRNYKKRFIVLIGDLDDLNLFNTKVEKNIKIILEKLWPGPFSIDLPVLDKSFKYLTRGSNSLAFRLPKNKKLIEILKDTGPIIAPSVNTEGNSPAKNIGEAKKYFPSLDFYIDGGTLENNPSTVVSIVDSKVKIWRQGQGIIPKSIEIIS